MQPPVASFIGAQRDKCASQRFQGWGSPPARSYLLKATFELPDWRSLERPRSAETFILCTLSDHRGHVCLSPGGNSYEAALLRALLTWDNRLRSDGDCKAVDLSAPPTPAGFRSNTSLHVWSSLFLYLIKSPSRPTCASLLVKHSPLNDSFLQMLKTAFISAQDNILHHLKDSFESQVHPLPGTK